jgi:hypothetical protein
MTATYTFDVFSSLDGFGAASGNWTGYWGKQGPELLDHRPALYGEEQRMVFGANTYRALARMLASSTEESDVRDPWVTRMRSLPATVVSTTLQGPLDWPDATVVSSGDGGPAGPADGHRHADRGGLAGRRHHDLAYRFFATAGWCPDQLGLVLLDLITAVLVAADARSSWPSTTHPMAPHRPQAPWHRLAS